MTWLPSHTLAIEQPKPITLEAASPIVDANATDPRKQPIPLDQSPRITRASRRREFLRSQERDAAVRDLYLPEAEVTLHLIMRATFRGFDVINATLHLAHPATIRRLYMATLSFNRQVSRELAALIDEQQIESVLLLCSVFYRQQQPEDFEHLRALLVDRGQRLAAARTHAKVIAMELSDGRHFVAETSGNLRSCSCLEQLSLTQSSELFEFHRDWIEFIANKAENSKSATGEHAGQHAAENKEKPARKSKRKV